MNHLSPEDTARWQAVVARETACDGSFVYGVASTGIFCRPSCPSRRPKRTNVQFFAGVADAQAAGFRACLRCEPHRPDLWNQIVDRIRREIEANPDRPIKLEALSRISGMSRFHLLRMFKKKTGLTPAEYGRACRTKAFKLLLRSGQGVTAAMHKAGFTSPSQVYEHSNAQLGMTPASYARHGKGARIRFGTASSPLGRFLVAATDKGICSIAFGDSTKVLRTNLQREFAQASLVEDPRGVEPWIKAVKRFIAGADSILQTPLDVRGTAFQWRVWRHLQTIPRGTIQTYSQVAAALGQPTAVRAVAKACATNRVALAVPCHRVARRDGDLAGYRWGLDRKRRLLQIERRPAK